MGPRGKRQCGGKAFGEGMVRGQGLGEKERRKGRGSRGRGGATVQVPVAPPTSVAF